MELITVINLSILGLRTIFPLFMKTPKKSKRRTLSVEEHEGKLKAVEVQMINQALLKLYFALLPEHVVSIISTMLRHCRGTQRQRLMTKFTENDHEKVDRLLELHFKYLDKVEQVDQEIEKSEKVIIKF